MWPIGIKTITDLASPDAKCQLRDDVRGCLRKIIIRLKIPASFSYSNRSGIRFYVPRESKIEVEDIISQIVVESDDLSPSNYINVVADMSAEELNNYLQIR